MALKHSRDLKEGKIYRSELDEDHLTVKVHRFSEDNAFIFMEIISGEGTHTYTRFDGLIKASTSLVYPAHWRDISEFKFGK